MLCYTQCPQPCSMPPLETPGHSWASLGQSLVGSCSLLLSPGVHKVLFVPSRSLSFQSCVSSGGSGVGLMATSSKRAYAMSKSVAPKAPAPCQSSADLYLHRRCSNTVLCQSLLGPSVLVLTGFVWALWASLVGMGFDSKQNFSNCTIFLGLLLCP